VKRYEKLWDKKTLQSTQLQFHNVVAVPMLTYASENWTIKRSYKRKIESAKMGFLHPVAGHTFLDQKRSSDIRLELQIFNLTERTERQK
jgi:hypothetical protein